MLTSSRPSQMLVRYWVSAEVSELSRLKVASSEEDTFASTRSVIGSCSVCAVSVSAESVVSVVSVLLPVSLSVPVCSCVPLLLEHPLKTREAVSARASSLDAVFFIMFLLKYKSQRS